MDILNEPLKQVDDSKTTAADDEDDSEGEGDEESQESEGEDLIGRVLELVAACQGTRDNTTTWSDHQKDMVRQFFTCSTTSPLLCCYSISRPAPAQGSRMALSSTVPRVACPRVSFFLRTSTDEVTTMETFQLNVCYGTITTEDPGSALNFMLKVYKPLVMSHQTVSARISSVCGVTASSVSPDMGMAENQTLDDKHPSIHIPKALRKDERLKAIEELANCHYQQLAKVPDLFNLLCCQLTHATSHASLQPALHCPYKKEAFNIEYLSSMTLLSSVEDVVGQWVEQVQDFSFQLRQGNCSTHLGLLYFIRDISSRRSRLAHLKEQLDGDEVQAVISFLRRHQSPLPVLLDDAAKDVQLSCEAVQCQELLLKRLEGPLRSLLQEALSPPMEPMYEVMAVLHTLWRDGLEHVRADFANLVVRASWDVAAASEKHVKLSYIFSTATQSYDAYDSDGAGGLQSPVDVALLCCKDWITCYIQIFNSKNGAMEQSCDSSNGNAASVAIGNSQWLPPPVVGLLPVRLLAARCDDLRYIWTSVVQLTRKIPAFNEKPPQRKLSLEPTTQSTKKDEDGKEQRSPTSQDAVGTLPPSPTNEQLEDELAQVDDVLKMALATIATKSKHAFNLTSKQWIKHFDRFRERIEEVERRYQRVMIASLQDVTQAALGLAVINRFRPMADRKTLFPVFFVMIDKILDLLEGDIEEAERQFIFRAVEIGQPNFSYSRTAKWCHTTRLVIQSQIDLIRLQRWLPYSPRLDASYRHWLRVSLLLTKGAAYIHTAWLESLEIRPSRRLAEPVLIWHSDSGKNFLLENFDKQLTKSLEEATSWLSLGMDPPEKMAPILTDVQSLKEAKEQVSEMATLYNNLISRLSADEARLFEGPLQSLVATYLPTVTSLTWNKRYKLPTLITQCTAVINTVTAQIDNYTAYNVFFYEQLDSIKSCLFFSKQKVGLYKGDEFLSDVAKQRNLIITKFKNKFGKIENDLFSLYEEVINSDSTKLSKEMWLGYVEKVDLMLLTAMKDVTLESMLFFQKILVSSREIPEYKLTPLFEVKISLQSGSIASSPVVDNLWEAVSHLKDILIDGVMKIPCLIRRYDLEKAKLHDHHNELNNGICSIQQNISDIYRDKTEQLKQELDVWRKFKHLFEIDVIKRNTESFRSSSSSEKLEKEIASYQQDIDEIENLPSHSIIGVFYVNYSQLKIKLIALSKSYIDKILDTLYSSCNDKLLTLMKEKDDIEKLNNLVYDSISDSLSSLNSCSMLLFQIRNGDTEFQDVKNSLSFLQKYSYYVPNETKIQITELMATRTNMESLVEEKLIQIKRMLDIFKKDLNKESEELKLEILLLNDEIICNLPTELEIGTEKSLMTIDHLEDSVFEIEKKIKMNETLKLLSLTEVQFPEKSLHLTNLSTAKKLWILVKDWKEEWSKWKSFCCFDVSVIALEATLSAFHSSLTQLSTQSASDLNRDAEDPRWGVFMELRADLEDALKLVPLLHCLQTAKMQQHHWNKLKQIICYYFDEKSINFSLGFIRDINLPSFSNEISTLINQSVKEFQLEEDIEEIINQSKSIQLEIFDASAIGVFVVQSITEASTAVSELIMKLRMVNRSIYVQVYREKVSSIAKHLNEMLSFLDEINDIQKAYKLWAPFFLSQDVRCHLIHATSFFEMCNGNWKSVSEAMSKEQYIHKIISHPEICKVIKEVKSKFNQFRPLVNDYLQNLREYNPRFNFLSDDDLMTIVSQINDVENMKQFFPKLLSNVSQIKIQKNSIIGGQEAYAVLSPDGEQVELLTRPLVAGPVSTWTSKVHAALTQTLKEQVKQCKANVKSVGPKLDELLKVFPLQVCSITLQLILSNELVKCKSRSQAGQDTINSQDKYFRDILSRFNRILGSTTQKNLRERVRLFYSTVLFLRDQLLRFRDDRNEKNSIDLDPLFLYSANKETGQLTLNVDPNVRLYGWEYQGVRLTPPLTAATRRHINRLLRNMKTDSVSCLIGERETGKSETIKIISQLTGCNLVTIECNPFLTLKFVTQILIGLIQTPTVLLLENGQTLQPEIVPVLSEMLLSLCNLKKTQCQIKAKQQNPLLFQGIPVEVHELSSIAVELCNFQDNSRFILETFRSFSKPITFYATSYRAIIEAELTIKGFKDVKMLASTLEDFSNMLETCLPSKPYNRFGLSFMKSIISECAEMIKTNEYINERDGIAFTVRAFVMRQSLQLNKQIFSEIFKRNFPECPSEMNCSSQYREEMKKSLVNLGLLYNDDYVRNLVTLNDTISKSRVTIVFGPRGSGKSTAIDILVKHAEGYKVAGKGETKKITAYYLDNSICGEKSLQTSTQEENDQGTEGCILSKLINEAPNTRDTESWIIFQSCAKSCTWVQTLLLQLNANGNTLCLNSQLIKIPTKVRLIIEVSGAIDHINSRELQKCRFIAFDSVLNFSLARISTWLRNLENNTRNILKSYIETYLIPLIANLSIRNKITPLNATVFITIIESFLNRNGNPNYNGNERGVVFKSFRHAIAWSFGDSEDDDLKEQLALMAEHSDDSETELELPKYFITELRNILDKNNLIITDKIAIAIYICKTLLDKSISFLLTSLPGSGKSTVLHILSQLKYETSTSIELNYNCSTTPSDLTKNIKSHLQRAQKDTFLAEKNRLILLVDNLNCAADEGNLSTVMSFVKLSVNQRRLFNDQLKDYDVIPENSYAFSYQINNTNAGLSVIERPYSCCTGILHVVELASPEKCDLINIFSQLFLKTFHSVDQSVRSLRNSLSSCLIEFVISLRTEEEKEHPKEFQPTHYMQNIKFLFDGLSMAKPHLLDKDSFLNIFVHETNRIFGDSSLLSSSKFMEFFQSKIKRRIFSDLCQDNNRGNDFVYLMQGLSYEELRVEDFQSALQENENAKHSSLIVFSSLAQHVSRIMRALSLKSQIKQGGNSNYHIVLLGPGGVGKRTAALMASDQLKAIVVHVTGDSNDQNNIKELLDNTRLNKKIVLFVECSVVVEPKKISFINDLLMEEVVNGKGLHVVLSLSSREMLKKMQQFLPRMFANIYINTFNLWSTEDLISIAEQTMPKKMTKSTFELAAKIHTECQRASNNNGKYIPSVHYLQFVKQFNHRRQSNKNISLTSKFKLSKCIEKFDEAKQTITELSVKLQEQRSQVTQIQQTCGNTVLKLKNIKSEQGRLEQELNKKADLLLRQEEESKRIKELINHDLAEPKLQLRNVHRQLNRVTVEEFDKIRTLLRPPPHVEYIFELTLKVIGLETTWNEAKKQMTEGIDFVTKIRETSAERIQDNILGYLQNSLSEKNYNLENMRETHPTAAIFLSWLITFEHYARVYRDYHPLQLQADAIEKDLRETQEAVHNHQHDLASFSLQQQVLQSQLQQKEQQLENSEQFMKTLETRILIAQNSITQLSKSKDEWLFEIDNCDSTLKTMDGDSLLIAAFVTYFGSFQYQERQVLFKELKQLLKEVNMQYNNKFDSSIKLMPPESSVSWISSGLSIDRYTIENFSIAMENSLISVIFDPNQIITTWILQYQKAMEIDLEEITNIETSISADKAFSIFFSIQEQFYIPVKIAQYLKNKTSVPSYNTSDCSLDGVAILEKEDPKIIIILRNMPSIPFPAFTSLVHNGNQLEGLTHLLSLRLSNGLAPEIKDSLIKNNFDLVEKRAELLHCKGEMQRLINKLDSSLLDDSSLMENLETISIQTIEITRKCMDLEACIMKGETSIFNQDKIARPLANLFIHLTKLSLWNNSISVSIEEFTNLVVGKLSRPRAQPRWGSLLNQNILLSSLSLISRHLQYQVGDVDEVTVGLLVTLWYHLLLNRTSQTQLTAFIKFVKVDTSCSVSPIPWMDDRKWCEINNLHSLPKLKKLPQSITEDSESWLAWCSSEYVESCSLPKPFEGSLVGFSRLLLLSKLRPDRLVEASQLYSAKHLKTIESATLESVQADISSAKTFEPIILDISPSVCKEDYLTQLQHLCYPLVEADKDSLQFVTLHRSCIKYIFEILKIAQSKGHWIAFRCYKESHGQIKEISQLLKLINRSECHRRFRVFLLFPDGFAPSANILPLHRRVNISEPVSIRESIEKYYKMLGETLISSYSTEKAKITLLAITLFHISMKARQEIESQAIITYITDAQWMDAEKVLRKSLATDSISQLVEQTSLFEKISELYLPGASTLHESRVIQHILHSFLDKEMSNTLTQRISSLTHYSIPEGNTLEDHTTQLEFIYKASNDSISNCSSFAIVQKQVNNGNKLKQAVKIVFDETSSNGEKQIMLSNEIDTLIKSLYSNVPYQSDSYYLIIKDEIHSFIEELVTIMRQEPTVPLQYNVSQCSEIRNQYYEPCNAEICETLKLKAQYLQKLAQSSVFPNKLTLRYFNHPEAIWHCVVRRTYSDFWTQSLGELVYVPHAERTKSGTSKWCLYLEEIQLRGAVWDTVGERIKPQDNTALKSILHAFSMPVVPSRTRQGQKIQGAMTERCAIPVYKTDNLSTDAMFHILLQSSIPQSICNMHNTRFILK